MPGFGFKNKVLITGNLGREPETRFLQSGGKVMTLSVATTETWLDKNSDERRERTEWHRVVIFNTRVIDFVERFVRTGMKVSLEGTLQTRKWTDQAGQDHYATEIVIRAYDGDLDVFLPARTSERDQQEDDDYGHGGPGDDHEADPSPPAPSLQEPESKARRRGSRRRPPAAAGAGTGGLPAGGDLDDDVPFGPCWQ